MTTHPGDPVWLWVATGTKSHYAQGWLDPVTGGVRPATTGGRLATLCQTGPMADARVYRTGRTVPPECKACWRRWSRILRAFDADWEHRR